MCTPSVSSTTTWTAARVGSDSIWSRARKSASRMSVAPRGVSALMAAVVPPSPPRVETCVWPSGGVDLVVVGDDREQIGPHRAVLEPVDGAVLGVGHLVPAGHRARAVDDDREPQLLLQHDPVGDARARRRARRGGVRHRQRREPGPGLDGLPARVVVADLLLGVAVRVVVAVGAELGHRVGGGRPGAARRRARPPRLGCSP